MSPGMSRPSAKSFRWTMMNELVQNMMKHHETTYIHLPNRQVHTDTTHKFTLHTIHGDTWQWSASVHLVYLVPYWTCCHSNIQYHYHQVSVIGIEHFMTRVPAKPWPCLSSFSQPAKWARCIFWDSFGHGTASIGWYASNVLQNVSFWLQFCVYIYI